MTIEKELINIISNIQHAQEANARGDTKQVFEDLKEVRYTADKVMMYTFSLLWDQQKKHT